MIKNYKFYSKISAGLLYVTLLLFASCEDDTLDATGGLSSFRGSKKGDNVFGITQVVSDQDLLSMYNGRAIRREPGDSEAPTRGTGTNATTGADTGTGTGKDSGKNGPKGPVGVNTGTGTGTGTGTTGTGNLRVGADGIIVETSNVDIDFGDDAPPPTTPPTTTPNPNQPNTPVVPTIQIKEGVTIYKRIDETRFRVSHDYDGKNFSYQIYSFGYFGLVKKMEIYPDRLEQNVTYALTAQEFSSMSDAEKQARGIHARAYKAPAGIRTSLKEGTYTISGGVVTMRFNKEYVTAVNDTPIDSTAGIKMAGIPTKIPTGSRSAGTFFDTSLPANNETLPEFVTGFKSLVDDFEAAINKMDVNVVTTFYQFAINMVNAYNGQYFDRQVDYMADESMTSRNPQALDRVTSGQLYIQGWGIPDGSTLQANEVVDYHKPGIDNGPSGTKYEFDNYEPFPFVRMNGIFLYNATNMASLNHDFDVKVRNAHFKVSYGDGTIVKVFKGLIVQDVLTGSPKITFDNRSIAYFNLRIVGW